MKRLLAATAALGAISAFTAFAAPPQDTQAGEQRFRELYKELVETNTTPVSRSCTLAAERLARAPQGGGLSGQRLTRLRGARSP